MVDDFPLRLDGRIPRAAKSPPSAVLCSTLRPLVPRGCWRGSPGFLGATPRGTDGMSRRPEERLKEGMDIHEHDRRIHGHRPRWRNQAGRLHVARWRRFELQPPRQHRRMGRAHPLERGHRLRRGHARLRQAQHRQGRSHLHLRLDGPDEVGEGWREVLWRHACLRADRAPKQGPNHGEDNAADAQDSRRPPLDDADIPF
jgi:hypothetical protein